MVEWRIGCSGFSYDPWVGPFYPKGLEARERLPFYARVFDTVELDSTFYRMPSRDTVLRWEEVTPERFLFTAKVPKAVTHDRTDPQRGLDIFEEVMGELGEKLGCLLLQYPPSFTKSAGWHGFQDLMKSRDDAIPYAVEFRHESWFTQEVYDYLDQEGITFCWSENDYADVPAVATGRTLYLRFIGEHQSIPPEVWGAVREDRRPHMRKWIDELAPILAQTDRIYAFFNNHFAGFGPGTANQFRGEIGMPMVEWPASLMRQMRDSDQASLMDFE